MDIKLKGYLKSTRLDREGAKSTTFEFSASEAVEIAKLELMSRDLKNHLPVLLEISVRRINGGKEKNRASFKAKYDFTKTS